MRTALAGLVGGTADRAPTWPELAAGADRVAAASSGTIDRRLAERMLLERGTPFAHAPPADAACNRVLDEVAVELFGDQPPQAVEARVGHRWARAIAGSVRHRNPPMRQLRDRAADLFNQPLPASGLFFLVMLLVFQAVFAWATPLMDLIDAGASWLGGAVAARLPEGMLASLLADGIIAGVGSVIIFLPQIVILFLFIIVLEDTGFLARSAFLVDRAMRGLGLSGQSVIPMLSSFACAVPAVMAARAIPTRRERIATIMAAPFMTCSARLPVYALLISAFVPQQDVGWFNLQGLVLFGLYALGIVGGSLTALLISRFALSGERSGFAMSLPGFRRPNRHPAALRARAGVPAARRHHHLRSDDRGLGPGLLSPVRDHPGGRR